MFFISRTRQSRAFRLAVVSALAMSISLVAAAGVMANPVPTDPEPDLECPDAFGDGLLTIYRTTVNTPADSNDWWVSVEFSLADEQDAAASCELSLSTYEQPDGTDPDFPQQLYDSDGGVFGAGTHTLTAQLPLEAEMAGCWFQYDFVWGPSIETLNSGGYGDRQIRSRIGGSDECPVGSLLVLKTDDQGAGLPGATFSVTGQADSFTSDENGWFCVDGLELDATVTVTETAAPAGYEMADPASQDVVITSAASCEERSADPVADATFENVPLPLPTPGGGEPTPTEEESPAQSPGEDVAGGTPTPAPGRNLPDTAAVGDQWSGSAVWLSIVLIASLGALTYLRLASRPIRRR